MLREIENQCKRHDRSIDGITRNGFNKSSLSFVLLGQSQCRISRGHDHQLMDGADNAAELLLLQFSFGDDQIITKDESDLIKPEERVFDGQNLSSRWR